MKRLVAWAAWAMILTVPGAQAQDKRDGGASRGPDERGGSPRRPGYANPSAVIAAEIAFNRLAQEKGQWTAFLATSVPGAEMFVPQRVAAADWLKRRPNPPAAIRWQPHAVWSSCDGSFAVTQGAWQGAGGKGGVFVTVWQRQPKKGDYRWVLDMGSTMASPPPAPEAIPAVVADCDGPALPITSDLASAAGDDAKTAVSHDGSLRWTSLVRADGSRRFRLTTRSDGAPKDVVDLAVASEPKG